MSARLLGCLGLLVAVVAWLAYAPLERTAADDKAPAKEAPVKAAPTTEAKPEKAATEWTDTYSVEPGELGPTGRNPYFILEPGYFLNLKKGNEELMITVLNETKKVDGVETRVIEEKETKDGHLVEISRNFFAISKRTNDVYYFGEEVDIYENDKITSHDGAWESGVKGAKFGLMVPGTHLVGGRYCNEVAPDVAMDRAEIISVKESIDTIAGKFTNCVKVEETTPLEPGNKEYKVYAPGIGLVNDDHFELVKYGKVEKK